ncbi:MAG TPA: AprI/Inh family metalloprotease inhibitor, partial [Caulobacteraceae bacterium]|nr:AprI/Inh family metalloprotease inhibitor [Caulobacteraceae bacterium]
MLASPYLVPVVASAPLVGGGLAAVLVMAAGAAVAQPDAASPKSAVGQWRLTQVGGKVTCTLTLTGGAAVGGWEMRAPLACRGAFPPLRDVVAWSFDPQGQLQLSDAAGKRVVALAPAAAGAYETKAPDGKTWRLEPLGRPRPLTARERISGEYRLTSAAGQTCDLSLRADIFGRAGWATPGQCAPPWGQRGIAIWTLNGSRLTLMDHARKPVLVLKRGE